MKKLSELIRQKNAIDDEIAKIIDYPSLVGHEGEFIASNVFGIELEKSAISKGIDGHFTTGNLANKTVNIKWYAKCEGTLDLCIEPPYPDYYLVLAGPRSAAISSSGTTRPWLINHIFLFNAVDLTSALKISGVKIGVETSIRKKLWEMAEIYPSQQSDQLLLSNEQKQVLALFGG